MTTALVHISHYKQTIPSIEYIEEVEVEEVLEEYGIGLVQSKIRTEWQLKRMKEMGDRFMFDNVDFGLGLGSVEINIVDKL